MAEKKSKVKAHRGFAHVRLKPRRPTGDPAPKRPIGRPQRPQITRLPRRPIPSFNNQQLQKMSDAQLRRYFNAQRRRSIAQQLSSQSRKRFLDRIKRANLSPAQRGVEISRYNAYLSNLRRGLDAQGKPIPKGIDIVKQFRQQMKQQQRMPTQKQIEEARKRLQQDMLKQQQKFNNARMGSKKQTAAPAQQAVTNPNIRRRVPTAEPIAQAQKRKIPNRRRTMVSKGGAVRKKK